MAARSEVRGGEKRGSRRREARFMANNRELQVNNFFWVSSADEFREQFFSFSFFFYLISS